jgi:hypothetical protein
LRSKYRAGGLAMTGVVLATMGLSGCDAPVDPAYSNPAPYGPFTIIENAHQGNVNHPLKHTWSPSNPIEDGIANSCIQTAIDDGTNRNYCRVVDGYEETHDNRDWFIRLDSNRSPVMSWAGTGTNWGETIVLDGGMIFEGCDFHYMGQNQGSWYDCDYRIRKPVIFNSDSSNSFRWGLNKFWDWGKYAGSAAGCSFGIASVWGGAKITSALLLDCAAGPL